MRREEEPELETVGEVRKPLKNQRMDRPFI